MKKLLTSICALGLMLGTQGAASAAQGCGPGWHRDPYGHCRPNRPPPPRGPGVVVVPPGLIIGHYYNGHGYWDGHRYWHHRRWHNNGWAYY
nr:hypothetical protein [uncultured Acidocella sp.]